MNEQMRCSCKRLRYGISGFLLLDVKVLSCEVVLIARLLVST